MGFLAVGGREAMLHYKSIARDKENRGIAAVFLPFQDKKSLCAACAVSDRRRR